MRKAARVAALLALAPLLLLAASGLALAQWDDQIDVNGSVSMGVFNLQLSDHGGWDNEPVGTDVGTFATSLGNNDDGDDLYDGGVNDLFTFTITNAYPGYMACFEFGVSNTGTIPAELQSATISIDTAGLEDPNDVEFIQVTLYHDNDNIADGDVSNDTMIAQKPFNQPAGNWTFAGGAADLLSAFQNAGINTIGPNETQIFTVCVEISGSNVDETLMNDSFGVSIQLTYVQAVP